MKTDYLSLAASAVDMEWVKSRAIRLNELERLSANGDFKASTDYVLNLLREAGFSEIERYALPCDGTTVYDDCVMPEAWDRTGRSTLEIVAPAVPEAERILADTDLEPHHATIWSVPTPPEGIIAPVIALTALTSDDWHEAKGKIVLCGLSPRGELMRKLALAGAVGLICFIREIADSNPDDVRWMNGPGLRGWYYVKGDLRLWNFSITPVRGLALERRLAAGQEVVVKAVMNTRVCDGEIYTVTGRIPGRSAGEIALLAHMYEPFIPDDAAGVVMAIALGKALREMICAGRLPSLEKSVRVIFSMERYGFSEYFHDRKRSRGILAALNMDSGCHATWKMAGVPLELRDSSGATPFFGEVLLRDHWRKAFPELPLRETAGNLSDETFCADPIFDIPCNWITTPPAPGRHHNTGTIFAEPDWTVGQAVLTVKLAWVAELASVHRGAGDGALIKRVRRGVTADFRRDLERLAAGCKAGEIHCFAARILLNFLTDYHTRRVTAVNRFIAGGVDPAEIAAEFRKLARNWPIKLIEGGCYDLSGGAARAAYLTVKRLLPVQPMSLARLPEAERHGFAAEPSMLLVALLDGKRTLYEAMTVADFLLGRKAAPGEAAGLVEYFTRLARYGYYELVKAPILSRGELRRALKELGLRHDYRVVVHSAYGALGGVDGGPLAAAETLVDYLGKEGILLMPSFNFPYYNGRRDDPYFDVAATPSCVGAISEEFRKMPGVCRSLNPSHSMAVWGREHFDWISDHHRTLAMGGDSPLGKLERGDGWALLIGCPDAATFMHVVETTNRVHCLGYRNEEFRTRLPDGRVVPVRTWGWRGGVCPAYDTAAIFARLRRKGVLREAMLRHAHLMLFKLADYRKAYERLLRGPKGCMSCPILPRVVPHCVASDWDWETMAVSPETTAFVGDWEP